MAVKDILAYLEANRGTYPPDVLVGRLRDAGYPESEIQAALGVWKPGSTLPTTAVGSAASGSFVRGFLKGGAAIIAVDWAVSFFFGVFGFWYYGILGNYYGILGVGKLLPIAAGIGAAYMLYRSNQQRFPRTARGVMGAIRIVGGIMVLIAIAGIFTPYLFWYF